MDDLLQNLNDQQKCAVTSPHPTLQVLAPPGSGKTKTLTARVAYLISKQGYKPWNIIVCTFTVKAAREMKERIRGIVGEELEKKLQLGTFHSIGRRFLVSYGHLIGIKKGFGIADSSDTKAIVKRIHKRLRSPLEAGKIASRISRAKAKKKRPAEFHGSKKIEEQDFARIYEEYEATLASSNLLDYDDILLRCVELLHNHPECVANVEAVLIDEFQDTNIVQYELMMLFAQHRQRITIVGDPDQSIYSFRSAEIENLNRMTKDLKDTLSIHLEQNYRSSAAILRCASKVIQQDANRIKKPLTATHCLGQRPVLRKLPSATDEAAWIVTEIKRIKTLAGSLFHHDDFAILLRSSALSLKIETALGKAGIPYRMVGGFRFFDRKEVRVLLDYLRVINQPNHNDALARVINEPPRKIGEATLRELLEEAENKKVSLWSLVFAIAQCRGNVRTKVSASALKGMQSFVNIILTCQSKIKRESDEIFSLVNLIGTIIDKIEFRSFLQKRGAGKDEGEDFEARWANVEELLAQATEISAIDALGLEFPDEDLLEQMETGPSPLEETLAQFLSNVALSSNAELKDADGEATKQVTISTLHGAKGLEWPVVFIAGVYDGSIPHSRADDTDEERRLLYVGMTRAQSLLYLSCPLNSSRESDSEHAVSPFLAVPELEPYCLQQGPSISMAIIEDLARILRRDCPSDRTVIDGALALERIEDDLYPLDGSRLGYQAMSWE
ncbi:UvrD-helicase-domain-containing protein, partial [Eremomyces bilateralis CBS 781.70]